MRNLEYFLRTHGFSSRRPGKIDKSPQGAIAFRISHLFLNEFGKSKSLIIFLHSSSSAGIVFKTAKRAPSKNSVMVMVKNLKMENYLMRNQSRMCLCSQLCTAWPVSLLGLALLLLEMKGFGEWV